MTCPGSTASKLNHLNSNTETSVSKVHALTPACDSDSDQYKTQPPTQPMQLSPEEAGDSPVLGLVLMG